eukprot:1042545-Amphidinium_carterae.1
MTGHPHLTEGGALGALSCNQRLTKLPNKQNPPSNNVRRPMSSHLQCGTDPNQAKAKETKQQGSIMLLCKKVAENLGA